MTTSRCYLAPFIWNPNGKSVYLPRTLYAGYRHYRMRTNRRTVKLIHRSGASFPTKRTLNTFMQLKQKLNATIHHLISCTALSPELQIIKSIGDPRLPFTVLINRFQCGSSDFKYELAVCVRSLHNPNWSSENKKQYLQLNLSPLSNSNSSSSPSHK